MKNIHLIIYCILFLTFQTYAQKKCPCGLGGSNFDPVTMFRRQHISIVGEKDLQILQDTTKKDSTFNFTYYRSLSIDNLNSLPTSILIKFTNVEALFIREVPIYHLSDSLLFLTKLESIYIEHSLFTDTIPMVLFKLPNLCSLNITASSVKYLPVKLLPLLCIRSFSCLSCPYFSEVSKSFVYLKNLQQLTIWSDGNIKNKKPAFFKKMPKLKYIDIK